MTSGVVRAKENIANATVTSAGSELQGGECSFVQQANTSGFINHRTHRVFLVRALFELASPLPCCLAASAQVPLRASMSPQWMVGAYVVVVQCQCFKGLQTAQMATGDLQGRPLRCQVCIALGCEGGAATIVLSSFNVPICSRCVGKRFLTKLTLIANDVDVRLRTILVCPIQM